LPERALSGSQRAAEIAEIAEIAEREGDWVSFYATVRVVNDAEPRRASLTPLPFT